MPLRHHARCPSIHPDWSLIINPVVTPLHSEPLDVQHGFDVLVLPTPMANRETGRGELKGTGHVVNVAGVDVMSLLTLPSRLPTARADVTHVSMMKP